MDESMVDDDEDVVFENSALHQHLCTVGYDADDVQVQQKCTSKKTILSHLQQSCRVTEGKSESAFRQLKNQFYGYVFDDAWYSHIRQLYTSHTHQIVEDVLKSSVLGEEDAAYVESYGSSLGSDRSTDSNDSALGQMLTQVGVLAVTMAYGLFRMFYLKMPEYASGVYVYALDVLSVIMTIVALAPAALKFATIGRVVGQLQNFVDCASSTISLIGEFDRLTLKIVLFIQEVEVIHRGFTFITAPISRLELSSLNGARLRQCANLRQVLFLRTRHVMLAVKTATTALLDQFPAEVELEGAHSYLANIPLADYGPSITVPDDDQDALRVATDDFCLSSLKSLLQMTGAHCSEFLRVLCLLCLAVSDEPRRASATGFVDQFKLLQKLSTVYHDNYRSLDHSYTLHRKLERKLENVDKQTTACGNRRSLTKSSPVYTAVHSLCLHLQAAMQRIESVDSSLDQAGVGKELDTLSTDTVTALTSSLQLTQCELTACRDCCNEALNQLAKLTNVTTQQSVHKSLGQEVDQQSSDIAARPLPVIPNSPPEIEDQVFEGFPEAADNITENRIPVCSEEEKRDSQEALRVLSELRTVIAVRAKDTEERERCALLRQNPELKFEETRSAESAMARALNNIGLASEECHVPVASANIGGIVGSLNSSPVAETSLQCSGEITDDTCIGMSNRIDSVADINNASCVYAKHLAQMAVAKSQKMVALSEDTFGDDNCSSDCDS